MATQVQFRGGTTTEHSTFTGVSKEVTVDTTKKTLVVHDGVTAGGVPLASEAAVNSKVSLTGAETVAGVKTLSSNPILSAGTANGVTYLNGSKVLTSGSALTFDGTNLQVGTGTASATRTLNVLGSQSIERYGATPQLAIRGGTDSTTGKDVRFNLTQNSLSISAATIGGAQNPWLAFDFTEPSTLFYTDGTERMRLTSTGLGIGTSSPATKLHVVGGTGEAFRISGTTPFMQIFGSSACYIGDSSQLITGGTAGDLAIRIGNSATNKLVFGMGATPVATLDSSGNLGIGTSSPISKLHVFKSSDNQLQLQCDNTGTVTIDMGGITTPAKGGIRFSDNSGSLFLRTNSTTQATLNSSGNLGLGVTPSAWGSSFKAFELSSGALMADNTATTLYTLQNSYFSGSAFLYKNTGTATKVEQVSGQFRWFNAPSGTAGAAISFTQAMTLDASGNLGIGTTSPAAKLHVQNQVYIKGTGGGDGAIGIDINSGASAVTTSAHAIRSGGGAGNSLIIETQTANSNGQIFFQTNGAERARIDSSGNLLVGTTNTNPAYNAVNGIALSSTFLSVSNTSGVAGAFNRNTDGTVLFWTRSGTAVGNVSVTTTATAYNTSSDYRLKNITGPITTSGAYIDSLNPVEGTWKIDGSTFVGLIAHEAQEASRTQVATGTKDGEEMQGMSYSSSEMIANMIAELKALRARVAALEASHP